MRGARSLRHTFVSPALRAPAFLDTNVRMRGTTKAVPMLCLRAPVLKAPPYQVLRVAMPEERMQHPLAVNDELIERSRAAVGRHRGALCESRAWQLSGRLSPRMRREPKAAS